ncbi:hemerythrin domain-containing protein [Caldimonas thermodepolymerans]|uniref:hemerythrin domain-containing protein n=1 Tax=Caldimonas thermodepolymerans TaxID=215580 RepID=UPI0022367878|nr:hemerythrin domain-containing protein [Caldimonas thermodepolymerans]UZG42730.1 hemerythrin domain-containing protein [Caldimonas thermodepolymerans]
MSTLLSKLSPSITDMIRMDHSQVLETFHQFRSGMSVAKKEALVGSACVALEIHTQLEEEIFYPALRELASDIEVLEKSFPEHAEMHRQITRLRSMTAIDPDYDPTFLELVRDALHHVADEETTLLPAAERLMPERLGELGAQMMRRRAQLLTAHAGEIMSSTVRSFPESAAVMASGAVGAGAYLMQQASGWVSRGRR